MQSAAPAQVVHAWLATRHSKAAKALVKETSLEPLTGKDAIEAADAVELVIKAHVSKPAAKAEASSSSSSSSEDSSSDDDSSSEEEDLKVKKKKEALPKTNGTAKAPAKKQESSSSESDSSGQLPPFQRGQSVH